MGFRFHSMFHYYYIIDHPKIDFQFHGFLVKFHEVNDLLNGYASHS